MRSEPLIPLESYGVFSDFFMALYTVYLEAKASDVIPVFSGSYAKLTFVRYKTD